MGRACLARPVRPRSRYLDFFLRVDRFFVAFFLVDRLAFFFFAVFFLVDRLAFFFLAVFFLAVRFLVDRLAFFFLAVFFLVAARFLVDRLAVFFLAARFFVAIFMAPLLRIPTKINANSPLGTLAGEIAFVRSWPG